MTLDVLIPTLPEEYSITKLKRLRAILDPQISDANLYIHDGPRSIPTGTKRNHLIKNSAGDYFVQLDSDDLIPPYYIYELKKAMESEPDVITFIGEMTTDGNNPRGFTIKLGSNYEERDGHYYRWPNHLCCFKRSVVEHIKFPDIWVQEDYQWSKKIRDLGLLKTEVHIDKHMYLYDFWDKTPKRHQRVRVR